MRHNVLTRAVAAAAAASLFAIAAPAFAQTAGPAHAHAGNCSQAGSSNIARPNPPPATSGNNTSGTVPSAQQNAGGNVASGVTTNGGSSTNCPGSNAVNGNNGITGNTTRNMHGTTTGTAVAQPPVRNMLSDNPNGPDWLSKFNRPTVMATTNGSRRSGMPPKRP